MANHKLASQLQLSAFPPLDDLRSRVSVRLPYAAWWSSKTTFRRSRVPNDLQLEALQGQGGPESSESEPDVLEYPRDAPDRIAHSKALQGVDHQHCDFDGPGQHHASSGPGP